MRNRAIWMTAVLLSGFLAGAPGYAQAGKNMLPNGGFESGGIAPYGVYAKDPAKPWTAEVVTKCVDADVHEKPVEGKYCLHIVVPAPAEGEPEYDVGMADNSYTFEKGKQYTFSCFMKCKSGTLQVRMKPERSVEPYEPYGEMVVTVTDTWKEYSVTTPVMTEDVTPASPTFHFNFSAGDFWIDDVRLYQVYESPVVQGCVVFEDHFDDFMLGPGWNTHFSTDGDVYEKTSEIGSILVVAANGADIWTGVDQYVAAYRSVEGDFEAIVQVQSQQDVDPWSKAGIAVRNDMSQNGTPEADGSLGYAGIFVTPGNGYTFQWDAGGGACGTSVSDLTRNPNYPASPDGSDSLGSMLWSGPWGDCYGQRISGWIRAPNQKTGGQYLFRIASDDSSELWLSTDDTPANLQLIAQVPGWTSRLESPPDQYTLFQYDKYPEQYSQLIELKPGKLYRIEVLHKEGDGDDFLAVQWSGPGVSGPWMYVKSYGFPNNPAGFFVREWWTTDWGPDGFLDSHSTIDASSYPCWLRLTKQGTSFSGSYSTTGPNGPWTGVGGATLDSAATLQDVGIMATSHSYSGEVGYNSFHYFALLRDITPPDFWLEVSPTVLWPPDHKMVEITPNWTVWDAADPSPTVTVKSITMNEGDEKSTYDPAQQPKGDGNTTGDMYVDAEGRIFLRAERSGTGFDRIYTITYEAADSCGNAAFGSATVVVPHDQAPVPADVTAPGDTVRGVPDDGDWPAMEAPPNAIDNDVNTKYLHFKGATQTTGFQVQVTRGPTIINEVTFTTANDVPERDPVKFEVYGATTSIDGPYTLIASGDILDFAGETPWPRFAKNDTPITFKNKVAYGYYQVLFPAVRDPAAEGSMMQIAEVELIGVVVGAS